MSFPSLRSSSLLQPALTNVLHTMLTTFTCVVRTLDIVPWSSPHIRWHMDPMICEIKSVESCSWATTMPLVACSLKTPSSLLAVSDLSNSFSSCTLMTSSLRPARNHSASAKPLSEFGYMSCACHIVLGPQMSLWSHFSVVQSGILLNAWTTPMKSYASAWDGIYCNYPPIYVPRWEER